MFNIKRTLAELEPRLQNVDPEYSSLTRRVFTISNKKPADLTPAELALCLRQDIASRQVMPLALEILETTPLLDVELYPGDLLWAAIDSALRNPLNQPESGRLFNICSETQAFIEGLREIILPMTQQFMGNVSDAGETRHVPPELG